MDSSEDSVEAVLTQDTRSKPWHPKLTAYRLFVLTTTIGLGTLKAIATSHGLSFVSTTIEWIGGVVLFSLIFILSLFEYSPPLSLHWFLQYDLMHAVWRAYRTVSLTPPEYNTDEKEIISLEGHPPITGYRVLCSLSVSVFGFVKALLAYKGAAAAAVNVVDYISGVALVSLLYVLGMYENNTANLMPRLFSADYSPAVGTCGYIIAMVLFHLCGSSLLIFITRLIFRMVAQLNSGPPVDFRLLYDGTPSDGPPTFLGSLHNKSTYIIMVMTLYFLLFFMVGSSLLVIGHYFYSLREYSIVRKLTATITKEIGALSRFAFRQFTPSRRHASPGFMKILRFIRRFGLHILLYTTACIPTALVAFFCVGFPFRIWYPQETMAQKILSVFAGVLYTIMVGGFGVFLCLCLLYLIWLLIAPFRVDWTSSAYQRTVLEL